LIFIFYCHIEWKIFVFTKLSINIKSLEIIVLWKDEFFLIYFYIFVSYSQIFRLISAIHAIQIFLWIILIRFLLLKSIFIQLEFHFFILSDFFVYDLIQVQIIHYLINSQYNFSNFLIYFVMNNFKKLFFNLWLLRSNAIHLTFIYFMENFTWKYKSLFMMLVFNFLFLLHFISGKMFSLN